MQALAAFAPVFSLLLLLLLAFSLPWCLPRFAWYRCVENWVWYRHWQPCAHPQSVLTRFPIAGTNPDLPDLYALVCPDCHTIFVQDTLDNWQKEMARIRWWRRLWQRAMRGGGV